jgi:hypothetical protein
MNEIDEKAILAAEERHRIEMRERNAAWGRKMNMISFVRGAFIAVIVLGAVIVVGFIVALMQVVALIRALQ